MENEVKSVGKNSSFDLKATIMGCLNLILAVVLKPVTALKSKIKDYADFKSAGILVLFVALAEMIINLLGTMISVIFVKKYNFFSGETKFEVSFEGLKDLDYFQLIVKDVFWILVIVAAIAGIYYIIAMIMKKNVNFFKLAAITAVSFVPVFAASFVGIIVAYIYAPLAAFLVVAAFIYSFLIFINAIDGEVDFKDVDFKIYFHTICLTVMFIIAYYVASNYIASMFGSASLF